MFQPLKVDIDDVENHAVQFVKSSVEIMCTRDEWALDTVLK